nr:alpha-crystallin B chain-like [Nomia melanderi]
MKTFICKGFNLPILIVVLLKINNVITLRPLIPFSVQTVYLEDLINLKVHAKHEEKTESKSVYREYNREFLLPKGVNPERIKSSLSKDGVLTVEAPLPAIGSGEKLIPIAQQ